MEIEAKFVVPNQGEVKKLSAITQIGAYRLGPMKRIRVRDTFYDSDRGQLQAARFVLRVRVIRGGPTLITLKTPGRVRGATHTRPEIEQVIRLTRPPRKLETHMLPPRIRALVLPIAGDTQLRPIFSTTQLREIRQVRKSRRVIAEWSLDRVRFYSRGLERVFSELEIELKHGGTNADLKRISDVVSREWGLASQRQSKFQRALEFMRAAPTTS